MAPQTVAADDERIAALVAKKKKLAEDIKKARKERARRIREANAAEAEKQRKERTHNLCRVAGMLVKLVTDGDQDLYQYLIKKIEPQDQELACIWADLPYEGKEPKGVLEAIAEMEAMKKDPNHKSYATFKEALAAMEAEDDGEEDGK